MKNLNVKFFAKFLKPYYLKLFVAFICSLAFVFFNIYIPIAAGYALDLVKGNFDEQKFMFYIYSILVSLFLSAVFYWFLSYISSKVSYDIAKDIRDSSFENLMKTKIYYIDNRSYGDIISILVNDISTISDGIIQMFIQLFTGLFTIIGTLVMMFIFSYQLALIVFLLTPISLICAAVIAKNTAKTFANQSIYRGKLSSFSNETISNQKVVIANSYQEQSEEKFNNIALDLKKHDVKSSFYSSVINPTTRLINSIIYLIVVSIGAILIFNNYVDMTTGNLMTFLMFTNNYTNPFNEISEVVSQLQTAYASLKRVRELNEFEKVDVVKNPINIEDKMTIEFEHVYFSYDKNKKLLQDISFKISKGQHVAIVGKTGCGKTTLINLLMRFYDIDKGTIKLNGVDIKKIKQEDIRSHIGMVLQDTWIFNGTIYDNIAYGKDNITKEEVIKVSKITGAHYFISQMEKGYDTIVSNTSGLSAGQKQLLCITRLMLNTPNILILDEATSNIDTLNEKLIQKDFDKIMENKTSIVIAHRLSTIQNADNIIVLDGGKIVEQGNHQKLIEKKGAYYELYNSQFAR